MSSDPQAPPSLLSQVDPPLVVDDASQIEWHDEADVVIVGFGGAGVACALEAREQGLSVLAIDRFEGGGATEFSGGVVYAGGTEFQREAGYDDTSEDMFTYLSLEESAVRPETLRRFCEGSRADIDWLVGHGVRFSGDLFAGKATYPPEGKFLYFSGNEKVPAYAKLARPVPRGHRTLGQGFTGKDYFAPLRNAALRAGARLLPHAPVRRLVVDREGAVLGVEARPLAEVTRASHQDLYRKLIPMRPFASKRYERLIEQSGDLESGNSNRRLIRGRLGVVLCGGGYVYGAEMLSRHRPLLGRLRHSLLRIGSMGCDGSAIELGRSVGGEPRLMDSFFLGRSISPPAAFLQGIIVDRTGKRFINEDAYVGFVGNAIANLPEEGRAWLILDRPKFLSALRMCLFPGRGMYVYTLPGLINILLGGTKISFSLSGLARRCRMDPGNLDDAIRRNNNPDANGQEGIEKSEENRAAIESGPYFAISMDLANPFAPTLAFSLGGLAVDEATGAVEARDGHKIDRLYAAGRSAVGLCSHGYLSGMSLADTVFSGRRAARALASGRRELENS